MALLKRLLFPPWWATLLLTAASAAGLLWVFWNDKSLSPIAYLLYAVSFYTVCALTAFFAVVLPRRYRSIRGRIDAHPVGHRYLTDPAFRTNVKLHTSLAVNLLYAGLNAAWYFLYRSMWFTVLAGYYAILAVMRFLLVRYVRRRGIGTDRLGELQRSKLCAYVLLLVNLALSGAVLMILFEDKGFHYPGVLIYVVALHTFYSTIHAIVELVRYRRFRSPVMTMAKIVALSAALVSMLNLETAMLSQFGADMPRQHQNLMIMLTGAGVSIAVITMSALMIARTTQECKEIQDHG